MNTIVLCGCFCSGTTVAARMLNRHPEIIVTMELETFSGQRLDHVIGRLRTNQGRVFEDSHLDTKAFVNAVLKSTTLTNRTILRLLEEYKEPQVRWYGDKLPAYALNLGRVTRVAGRPKVICCIRDARDVMESQVRYYHRWVFQNMAPAHWMRETIEQSLKDETWLMYMQRWESFKMTTRLPWYELIYDNVTEDIEREAIRVAEFVGVETELMVRIFRGMFCPRGGQWKTTYPNLNTLLPRAWIEMMLRYGFQL